MSASEDEDFLKEYGQTPEQKKDESNDSSAEEPISRGFLIAIIVLFIVGALFFGALYFSLVKGSGQAGQSTETTAYLSSATQ